jgi:hypothetical protein
MHSRPQAHSNPSFIDTVGKLSSEPGHRPALKHHSSGSGEIFVAKFITLHIYDQTPEEAHLINQNLTDFTN